MATTSKDIKAGEAVYVKLRDRNDPNVTDALTVYGLGVPKVMELLREAVKAVDAAGSHVTKA